MRRPADRTGQVWESKSKFSSGHPATITGEEWHEGEHERFHVWTARSTDVFGKPFTFTIAESVLKREYRRRRDLDHQEAP